MHIVHITHRSAVNGATRSCHQMDLASGEGVLIDCGLFQGREIFFWTDKI